MNVLPVSAITGSIGNAKMILYPEINGWTTTTIEKTILVKNTNNVSVNISLKLDENSSKFLEIIDKEFILEANTEKKARFEIKVKKEGEYRGKINVFFTPIEGKEAGVVLPSTIIVIAKKNQGESAVDESTDENEEVVPVSENETGNSKISPVIIISFVSTLILLAVLIFLIYLIKSKKKKAEMKDSNKAEKKENKKIKKAEKDKTRKSEEENGE